jgi:hypothetical protein
MFMWRSWSKVGHLPLSYVCIISMHDKFYHLSDMTAAHQVYLHIGCSGSMVSEPLCMSHANEAYVSCHYTICINLGWQMVIVSREPLSGADGQK